MELKGIENRSIMPRIKNGCRSLRVGGICTGGGPKFSLLQEIEVQVCLLNHQKTLVSKLLGSKFMRRWESHRLILSDCQILSSTVGNTIQSFQLFLLSG